MGALQRPPQAELLFTTQFLCGCLPLQQRQRLLSAAQFRLLSGLPDRCAEFHAARTAPTDRKITFSAQDCYSAHSLLAMAPYSFSIVRCFTFFLLPLLFSAQFFPGIVVIRGTILHGWAGRFPVVSPQSDRPAHHQWYTLLLAPACVSPFPCSRKIFFFFFLLLFSAQFQKSR